MLLTRLPPPPLPRSPPPPCLAQGMYHDLKRFSDVVLTPGVCCFFVDSSIYFANQQYIKEKAETFREKYSSWSTNLGV